MSSVPTIEVRGAIRLGQFLKLSGLVEDGAEARELIQSGDVCVNGEVETRRGHSLEDGELVELHCHRDLRGARERRRLSDEATGHHAQIPPSPAGGIFNRVSRDQCEVSTPSAPTTAFT